MSELLTFPIIDTHTHLCDPVFDADREDVLRRAGDAGIVSILVVGETIEDAEKNIALSDENAMLAPLAGLYPTILDIDLAQTMIALIRKHREKLVGIGEVGLDFWAVQEPHQKDMQKAIFRLFITLSKEVNLPLNVHSRSAGHYAVDLLLREGAKRVQLHAFDGKGATALPAVEAGYYFSIPPSIVRSQQKRKLVKSLPLSCLLLETDSPVLGSVPDRRNEPKFILESVDAIAEIKSISRDEVIEATYHNTLRLYGEDRLMKRIPCDGIDDETRRFRVYP
jgi:TatD DNase family protein